MIDGIAKLINHNTNVDKTIPRIFPEKNPIKKISKYNEDKFDELMNNEGIIRNRLKIKATISNATAFINIQKEFGSFSKYIWNFVDNKPIQNNYNSVNDVPAKTELSDKISLDLKKRGFKFVGSTIVYSHMQATGMVNDHTSECFRYKEIQKS